MIAFAFERAARTSGDGDVGGARREAFAEHMLDYLRRAPATEGALQLWLGRQFSSSSSSPWTIAFQQELRADRWRGPIADILASQTTENGNTRRLVIELKVGNDLADIQVDRYLETLKELSQPDDEWAVVAVLTRRALDRAGRESRRFGQPQWAAASPTGFRSLSWSDFHAEVTPGMRTRKSGRELDCWTTLTTYAESAQYASPPLPRDLSSLTDPVAAGAIFNEWRLAHRICDHWGRGKELIPASNTYGTGLWIMANLSGNKEWGIEWSPDESGLRPLWVHHRVSGSWLPVDDLPSVSPQKGAEASWTSLRTAIEVSQPAKWPQTSAVRTATGLLGAALEACYGALVTMYGAEVSKRKLVQLNRSRITFRTLGPRLGIRTALVFDLEQWANVNARGPVPACPPTGLTPAQWIAECVDRLQHQVLSA